MKIVVRTHGGLGNQIFQILYARLLAKKMNAKLYEVHDENYKHKFSRSKKLARSTLKLGPIRELISAARLPKIAKRFGLNKGESIQIFDTLYLDGYFQSANQYNAFSHTDIGNELNKISDELEITSEKEGDFLVHFRLGDFFKSRGDAREYVAEQLPNLLPGTAIITNDEKLVSEIDIKQKIYNAGCKVLSTSKCEPEEIIRLMAKYKNIISNDSTLTLWASVFGGCHVNFKSEELHQTRLLFIKAKNNFVS